jgi:hypothetical protein
LGEEEDRMKRSVISMMVVGLGMCAVANGASADASPIAIAMGDLRWGLSEREVSSYAKRQLNEHYSAEIAKTKDAGKQSKLKADLKQAQSEVDKSLTNFEGGHSRWDSSPVAGEFTYDNNESMLVAHDKQQGADSYFFFVNGHLWKHVQVLDKHAAGGDFKKFSHNVEDKYGKGRAKKAEVTPGQGPSQFVEYLDRNSRMRAVDESAKRGGFAMIYEEMATVRELASTRPKQPTRLGGVNDDDEAAAAKTAAQNKANSGKKEEDTQIAKAPTKRSVFGNERQQENETEFQTRKQKVANEARERAQRAQARKEDAKKGEALKQLDGLSDSDPLGGL